ncbi:hypothetical protein [Streptomyces sp. TR06-5]|uniref:hypothetical protein n=1 Tax=unclassified Streptomyces TaxID=2593676 RepID=UPI0039A1884F
MTPPPPPLPFRLTRRGSMNRAGPALDDASLAAAREALAQGRWAESRTLLAGTGEDWDLRGHRLLVLAGANGSLAWAREWQMTEPDSADAAALAACALADSASHGLASGEDARKALEEVASRVPADPTPWLARLRLARDAGAPGEARSAFEEVRARHRDHHHAHHLMAAVLADDVPAGELYDFAQESASRAGHDSPLAVLPVVAHAERFRVDVEGGEAAPDALDRHWNSRRAHHLVRTAFDWWLEWGGEARHPRRMVDLNFLAHAKFHEGRFAEAAALFQRIGEVVTPAPWAYAGRDANAAFRSARDAALGAT